MIPELRERVVQVVGGGLGIRLQPVLDRGADRMLTAFEPGPVVVPAAVVVLGEFAAVFEAAEAQRELDELLAWVAEGRLVPPAGRAFAFNQYREALTYALSGEGLAKTIFEVTPT